MERSKVFRKYGTQVLMNKLPKNCKECPFYYEPNPDNTGTWYEYHDCFLVDIEDSKGIYLKRYSKCPLRLNKEE